MNGDKHYNLTVTDDNGKSLTTTNVSTKHPDEIVRLMTLAGLAQAQAAQPPVHQEPSCGCQDSCGCQSGAVEIVDSVDEAEYEPTGPQEFDLDDFSKKTADSISRQRKRIQPSKGDNPLMYSLDEDDIYESLLSELTKLEESKAKNPYAIGMAAAKKEANDEPPLKKSTIKKAHKIAKSVKADESSQKKSEKLDEARKVRKIEQIVNAYNATVERKNWVDYNLPGLSSWTRGDGSRYRDPGNVVAYFNPRDKGPVDAFVSWLKNYPKTKHIGGVKDWYGSSKPREAYALAGLLFTISDTGSVQYGSTSRLKNTNVWSKTDKTNEDTQLDELSPQTMTNYISKASDATGHRNLPLKKVDNRYAGVARASNKLDRVAKGLKKGDFVTYGGKLYRIFGFTGSILNVGEYLGPDSYGGTTELHISKVRKADAPMNEAPLLGPQGKIHRAASADQSDREYIEQRQFKDKWKSENPGKPWPGYEKAGFKSRYYKSESVNQKKN